VYGLKRHDEVSWYAPHLTTSLELIRASGLPTSARIIDVGGGASTLVDDLLAQGYGAVTVLDVSAQALAVSRRRLGDGADAVHWIVGDVTEVDLDSDGFDIWHDRASLHFLTKDDDLHRYVATLSCALATGGHAIIATFAPEGPEQCSGLTVRRYDAQQLCDLLGDGFECLSHRSEVHTTPSGNPQAFTYTSIRKAC
jgi:ubiquinone/menaquinone biosynthesis C-methylase UbiE